MKNEFVPHSTALRLKALGFNEPCLKWFIWRDKGDYQCVSDFYDFPIDEDGGISAPTWQSAFRWFREKYFIVGYIIPHNQKYTYHITSNHIKLEMNGFKTHEEAELDCLEKLIEIVESKKE